MKETEREEIEPSVRLDSSAVYGDAARMPPSSVLSTRYRTARRYPVIRWASTALYHNIVLLLARCSASASAGAAEVKWCQFSNESVHAGWYAALEGIRVWQCDKPGIVVPSDSRVTLSKTDRLAFVCSCMHMCRYELHAKHRPLFENEQENRSTRHDHARNGEFVSEQVLARLQRPDLSRVPS